MTSIQSLLFLNQVAGITALQLKTLEQFDICFESLYLDPTRYKGTIPDLLYQKIIKNSSKRNWVLNEIHRANEKGISLLSWDDDNYPSQLLELTDPPPVLYAQGDLSLLKEPCLAIVGSRRRTFYAKQIVESWIPEILQEGWCTVSGGAYGVDHDVHKETLKNQGKTIAVLGSGLLKLYPKNHYHLFQQIAESGLLLSEFHLQSVPLPQNFLQRNRIIAGLSQGTVVIEAAQQSGALVTAKLSLDQGRDVFAVPGSIYSATSRGTHQLIQQGAKLVQSVQDIQEECSNFTFRTKKQNCFKEESTWEDLTSSEDNIYQQLSIIPQTWDDLLHQMALPPGEFAKVLLNLERKGKVKSLPGNRYVRN